jgi:hypothetical protein
VSDKAVPTLRSTSYLKARGDRESLISLRACKPPPRWGASAAAASGRPPAGLSSPFRVADLRAA